MPAVWHSVCSHPWLESTGTSTEGRCVPGPSVTAFRSHSMVRLRLGFAFCPSVLLSMTAWMRLFDSVGLSNGRLSASSITCVLMLLRNMPPGGRMICVMRFLFTLSRVSFGGTVLLTLSLPSLFPLGRRSPGWLWVLGSRSPCSALSAVFSPCWVLVVVRGCLVSSWLVLFRSLSLPVARLVASRPLAAAPAQDVPALRETYPGSPRSWARTLSLVKAKGQPEELSMAQGRSAAQQLMEELADRVEAPPEWAGRKCSTDIYYYHTDDSRERQLNLEMYLVSYPWILRVRDANGYLAYHCGLCNRHATVSHLLTSDHNRRAALTTPWAGSRKLPQWMMQWRAPMTDADGAGLLSYQEKDVWPFGPPITRRNVQSSSARDATTTSPVLRGTVAHA